MIITVFSKVILGKTGVKTTSFGRVFSANVLQMFYYPDDLIWSETELTEEDNCDGIPCSVVVTANLSSLIERIKNNDIKEIILALKPSIEGETTMQYIRRILDKFDVKVTKIATGIPIGTDIEYIDNLTLELALEERKEVS